MVPHVAYLVYYLVPPSDLTARPASHSRCSPAIPAADRNSAARLLGLIAGTGQAQPEQLPVVLAINLRNVTARAARMKPAAARILQRWIGAQPPLFSDDSKERLRQLVSWLQDTPALSAEGLDPELIKPLIGRIRAIYPCGCSVPAF